MDADRLVAMANQIARNLAAGADEAQVARGVARHIADFWDPRMKAALRAVDPARLDPPARAALALLGTPVR